MKTLFLARHASAQSGDTSTEDIDKPLSQEGMSDAAKIGQKLRDKDIECQIIVASPAVRAMTTAQILAEHIKFSKSKIQSNRQIYENTVENALNVIAGMDDDASTAMIVGHNPTLSALAAFLTDNANIDLRAGSVIGIKLNTEHWYDYHENMGTIFLELNP